MRWRRHALTLLCTWTRWGAKPRERRGLVIEYALQKLKQIETLPCQKIDTTNLNAEAVANRIISLVAEC